MKLWKTVFVLGTLVTIFCGMSCNGNTEDNVSEEKILLMIVEDGSTYDEEFISPEGNAMYDIAEVGELSLYDRSDYSEIAAPYSNNAALINYLKSGYDEGKKIYMYGELTFSEFCETLDIEEYSFEKPIDKIENNALITEYVEVKFSDEYMDEVLHNVIAIQKNSAEGLIASVPQREDGQYDLSLLLRVVVDDISTSTFADTIASSFNIKAYSNGSYYALLDWFLYQGDTAAGRTFYGVQAKISLQTGSYGGFEYKGDKIFVDMSCVNEDDEWVASGPGSSVFTRDFSISLPLGLNPTASVGWGFAMSNAPTITQNISQSKDYVSWTAQAGALSFDYLEGEVFSPGMAWSTAKPYAEFDIDFRGRFQSTAMGLTGFTSWKNVRILVTGN